MKACCVQTTQKFVPIPVGANKDSHISDWPSLIRKDAPKVYYNQNGTGDLCVSKSFASILHHVGFIAEAKLIDTKFQQKIDCFSDDDCNLCAIYKYASKLLPSWMQCTAKGIKNFDWDKDIQDFDLFLGVLIGSDGHINHAVAIFNKWIFDSNEKSAIPLCQEGLNYCVSSKNEKVEFLGFKRGFFFRENSKKSRLKRKMEGEDIKNLSKICREWSVEN